MTGMNLPSQLWTIIVAYCKTACPPQLADKVKVCLAADTLACQVSCDVAGMDINDNEGTEHLALQLAELPTHFVDNLKHHHGSGNTELGVAAVRTVVARFIRHDAAMPSLLS